MSLDETLARLSAGLDRDQQLAQLTSRPDWDATPEGTVEAFRSLLRLHEEAVHDSVLSDRDAGFEAGVHAALELLASIYPEGTEETG